MSIVQRSGYLHSDPGHALPVGCTEPRGSDNRIGVGIRGAGYLKFLGKHKRVVNKDRIAFVRSNRCDGSTIAAGSSTGMAVGLTFRAPSVIDFYR